MQEDRDARNDVALDRDVGMHRDGDNEDTEDIEYEHEKE